MNRLDGKVAVVTGGGTGIGRAISLQFAREGADVVIASNVAAQAEAVAAEVRELGRKGAAYVIDVTDVSAVEAMAAFVDAEFSKADILVTCAGIKGSRAFLTETPVELWRRTIEINLNAGFYCIKAFLPGMLSRNEGRVIMISSISGKMPAAMNSDYAASKHGVIGLTKALALELGLLGKNGITANAICPGAVVTPMLDQIADQYVSSMGISREDFNEKYVASKNIQHRLLDPDEVACMAAYLASDQARGVTGQALNVCGGTLLF